MRSFSQRKGIKPIRRKIQSDSMDGKLRTDLWNALYISYWHHFTDTWKARYDDEFCTLCERIWIHYFSRPLDELYIDNLHNEIKEYFFRCEWSEVYDFIEFVANNDPGEWESEDFMKACNVILERQLSAYRFVGGRIVDITSEEEISEIEEALETPMPPVREHLNRALELLSDRENPDYRNSIKESISGVESLCIIITENRKPTLGQALKEIEDMANISLHPALKKAFSNLYGYTSDADGIRHGLMDEPNLGSEDAKFMLVACSAFINYLVSKISRVENDLQL